MHPRKLLNLRDKNGSISRREKNGDSDQLGLGKIRPRSAELFFSLFKPDAPKHITKDDHLKDQEGQKIEKVTAKLAEINITGAAPEYIRNTLATKFADGDVDRAARFIDFQQKAAAGKIVRYNPNVMMLGAVNRGNVTCYLDALLFAMFSRFDAFERMLKRVEFDNEPRQKLATLLRLWVNLLRSGELIQTDTTELIQNTLAECGWTDAKFLEQQDTSEAFNFITETLELPLLSLKVDLFHQGKTDEDDHKIIYERLLNLAVPPDPDGKGIKLEDCLEEYFNAQVDVFRDSLDEKAAAREAQNPDGRLLSRTSIPPVNDQDTATTTTPTNIEAEAEATPQPLASPQRASISHTLTNESQASSSSAPPPLRPRAATVIQRVILDEYGRATSDSNLSPLQRTTTKGSVVVKAVTIPAWQFFRLMPWHTPSAPKEINEPESIDDLEKNIRQRPVLGICLKRYAMTQDGFPIRQNTHIDIPDVLRLPNFMLASDESVEEDPHGLSTGYKLVLQSVVCHRGDSLHSGHYIALARVDPKLLTENRRCDPDPPPDYEEAQWVKFDDLSVDGRVTYVDDIRKTLEEEMPYLLFYQIVPTVEVPASTDGTNTEPPSYTDLGAATDGASSTAPTSLGGSPRNSVSATPASFSTTNQPSIRLSTELDLTRSFGTSGDEGLFGTSSLDNSRRQSAVFSESFGDSLPVLSTAGSQSPPAGASSEESTATRLSRAAARFSRGSKSRTPSQQGDNRISSTIRHLGLLRSSKEPLRDPTSAPPAAPAANGAAPLDGSEDGSAPDPVAPVEDLSAPTVTAANHTPAPASKHRRGKTKAIERREKAKGDDPERECTVM